ncbi:BQ2448_400 [Microbotryum intermedium]|uniref:BQ2448_400 protein n=1 Tax=Microbotryum intermedium TaxID=269621 RepID=A0A238F690_9BASI|nr:BQ2448_400 [Microbotryum intermedium]
MTPNRSASPARSDASGSSSAEFDFDFMQEPESFRPKTPPPTTASYTRRALGGHGPLQGPEEVQIRLVGGHPLWGMCEPKLVSKSTQCTEIETGSSPGHLLYPAAIALSRYLETHAPQLLHSPNNPISDPQGRGKGNGKGKPTPKRIIELGAGGGLPALIAALESDPSSRVIISDYPDQDLVDNLQHNIGSNGLGEDKIKAKGFAWGHSVGPLVKGVWEDEDGDEGGEAKFDVVLLSDLVFNHSQHSALLESCKALLKSAPSESVQSSSSIATSSSSSPLPIPSIDLTPSDLDLSSPLVLCFFSHHRPTDVLIKADMGLMELAQTKGWTVSKVWEDPQAGPAFPQDKGNLAIRSTVHGYAFTLPPSTATTTTTSEA